ncbi:hypothetical protein GW17_00024904 [Ensete ventricosum]|nr:hypothetical protein GW17_00024904 [Ensete ventricosum]
MGGTYRSVRLPVCGPPATGWYHQKSIVGDRLREKSTVGGRLREKMGRRRRRGKEEKRREEPTFHATSSLVCRRRPRVACAPLPPSPAGAFSPTRGDVPPKIDCWRPIEGENGKKKKRKRRKKKRRRRTYFPRDVLACVPSLPAGRPRTVAALARGRFFSHARRRNVSPRGEKDRGDVAPFFL